ncbi:MAG: hypothetical protein QXH07_01200 [Thermoplasmata archaeon]
MLPLLLVTVLSSSSGNVFSFLNSFFSGISNFFTSFFTPAQDPPAQLVSTSGSVFDLPNSNIVEAPPNLPSLEIPINPTFTLFNPSISNFLQTSLFGNNAYNEPTMPSIPYINH